MTERVSPTALGFVEGRVVVFSTALETQAAVTSKVGIRKDVTAFKLRWMQQDGRH